MTAPQLADDLDGFIADAMAPDTPTDDGGELTGERRQQILDGIREGAAESRWRIDDDGQAEWAARKLAQADRRRRQIAAVADRVVEQARLWEARQLGPVDGDFEFFEALLVDYAKRQREGEGRKTVDLPSATVKSRSKPAKVDIVDDETVTEWAKRWAEEAVKVTEKTLVSRLRDHVQVRRCIFDGDGKLVAVEADDGWETATAGLEARLDVTGGGDVVDVTSGEVEDGLSVEAAAVAWQKGGDRAPRWVRVPGAEVSPESVSYSVKVPS